MAAKSMLCLASILVFACRSSQIEAGHKEQADDSSAATAAKTARDDAMALLASPSTSASQKYDAAIKLGWATPADKADYLRQEAVFQERIPELRKTALGKWAVVVRESLFLADNYPEVLKIMEREGSGRQFYVSEIK